MENKIWKVIGFWALALLLLVATLIIFRWALAFYDWARLDAAVLGTWIGGLGTVFTLIWTIRLATAETRRREHQEMVVARLRGAGMAARIESANIKVFMVVTMLHFAVKGTRPVEDFAFCEEELAEIKLWTIEEAIQLVPLPSNVAIKLAEVVDHIHTVRATLNRMSRMGFMSPEYQRERSAEMLKVLDLTLEYLQDAKRECRLGAVQLQLITP